jgi:hypothetical protein
MIDREAKKNNSKSDDLKSENEKKTYQIKNSNIQKMNEYLKKQEKNDTRKH